MSGRPIAFAQSAVGLGALCGMDAVVKHLAGDNPVTSITLARYVAGTLLALVVWQAQGRPRLTREMMPAHLLRGGMIAAMALSFYWSLTKLPLAEAITLSFIAPLLVPPLASLFLGERMQPRYVAAALLGFVGVVVTVQGAPDFSGDRLLALGAVLFSAVVYAGSLIVMRARARTDGSTIITLLGAAVPMLFLAPFAIGAPPPNAAALGWFMMLGLLGNIGMQLVSRAYARVEAQALAVMEFTALPWAALLGWLFFAEPVRPQVWAGAAIIAGACIWASRASGDVLAEA